ncbi:MAG: hypothetical protein ABFD94_15250 [Armatimonadia bacterium]
MKPKLTSIIAFLLPALLALYVGQLALARHLVDWNALAAAAHAYDVFHRLPQANMALIGFVQPPLPALIYLPLSLLAPGCLASGCAAVVVGAVFMGLSTLLLYRLAHDLNLSPFIGAALVAIFALHPLILSYAALGAPAIILIFTYLGLARAMIGWHRTESVRDLVAAAIYAAAAIIVAYEAAIPVLAAALLILSYCSRGPRTEASKAEGTLIAFLLPAAYVAAVWLLCNWVIMGHPLYFWRETLATQAPPPLEPGQSWVNALLLVTLAAMPLLFALIYDHLIAALRTRRDVQAPPGLPVATLALAALISPAIFPTLRTSATGPALWPILMPLVAAAIAFGYTLLPTLIARYRIGPARPSAGLLIIAVGCLVLSYHLNTTGQGLPNGFRSVMSGYAALGHTDTDERLAAASLQSALNPSTRNLIAGWPGFAIALYGRTGATVEVLPTSLPPAADLQLESGSTVVLLNEPDVLASWRARLPHHLRLSLTFTAGKWTGYKVALTKPDR